MPMERQQIDGSKGFDADSESRLWKEMLAAETAGLDIAERISWFRLRSSVSAIRKQAENANFMLHENPPVYRAGRP